MNQVTAMTVLLLARMTNRCWGIRSTTQTKARFERVNMNTHIKQPQMMSTHTYHQQIKASYTIIRPISRLATTRRNLLPWLNTLPKGTQTLSYTILRPISCLTTTRMNLFPWLNTMHKETQTQGTHLLQLVHIIQESSLAQDRHLFLYTNNM